jgi:uncharacterized protein YndB with AHSA1/START domain
MYSIIHRIGIKAKAPQIYKAVSTLEGLSKWWTEEVKGDEESGGRIEFRFSKESGELLGLIVMELEQLNNNELIKWRCIDGPAEWLGNIITFEISEKDGQTILLFAHRGWKEEVEFMHHCSMKWATFLLSLREYVETGKGKPSPHDFKIDNWN